MTLEETLALIDHALGKIPDLRSSFPDSPEHVAFVQSTGLDIARIFGPDSAVSRNFTMVRYDFVGTFFANPFTYERERAARTADAYQRGLNQAEGILRSAREQLTTHGADNILRGTRIRTEGPRVFISHGKETGALTKIERFVRSLGGQPVVVVREPSKGMAVDDLVEARMAEADCAIILATADDEVDGKHQPRANVIHEIGLAQEKLDDRIVYLKEAGCEFPSNVRPKVWENFTQDNMEAAFEKIVKELRAFDLL